MTESDDDAWEDADPSYDSGFVGFAMPPEADDLDDSDDYEDPVNPMQLAWTAPAEQRKNRGRNQETGASKMMGRGGVSAGSKLGARKRREEDGGNGRQVLPVGELPPAWDGVPTNGAEFLAMMRMAERDLPFSTTAPPPPRRAPSGAASAASPAQQNKRDDPSDSEDMDLDDSSSTSSSDSLQGPFPTITTIPTATAAGPSRPRHPALPTPEWRDAFGRHFIGYRTRLAEQRPVDATSAKALIASCEVKPPLGSRSKADWGAYIHGAKRRKLYVGGPKKEVTSVVAAIPDGFEEDEETALNDGLVPVLQMQSSKSSKSQNPLDREKDDRVDFGEEEEEDEDEDDDEDEDEEQSDDEEDTSDKNNLHVLEPELPKHRPAEPLTSVIQAMSLDDVHFLLGCFSGWLENNLATAADPPYLVSTSDEAPQTYELPPNVNPHVLETPLLPHHARWIFALLLRVDAQLLGTDISDLRDLAKLCLNVVRWQVYTRKLEPPSEEGSDQTATNADQERMRTSCWMIHQAITAGWGQHDLLVDAEDIFAGMPLSGTGAE